jgi:hypothetical protein
MKECKFTNKVEAALEPQNGLRHSFPERPHHDVTQTINDLSVWTTRKYVAFVNRNRKLYDEMMERRNKPHGYKFEKGWEGKYRMHGQSIKRK